MKTYFLTPGILALLCCAAPAFGSSVSICDGVSGNLVQNCGFETGNFSSWTVLNDDGNTNVERNSFSPPGVNSGVFFAALGNETTTPTIIEQTLADISGSTLTFSFYLASDGAANDFTAAFDGKTLLSLPDAPAQGYQQYSYTVTATGSDTIAFGIGDAVGFDGLDDVVVAQPQLQAAPEPSSLAFGAAAIGAIALVRRRRAKKVA
jgi:MYXO-CTERM domain-containing protein